MFAGILMTALGFEPAPVRHLGDGGQGASTTLREQVRDKNQLWFYRFRPLNAEYVVGRRVNPFGSVNFPAEMKRLDERIAEQDQRIWRQARDRRRSGEVAMTPRTRASSRRSLALGRWPASAAAQTPPRQEPNLGGDLDLASQDPTVALDAAQAGRRLRGRRCSPPSASSPSWPSRWR